MSQFPHVKSLESSAAKIQNCAMLKDTNTDRTLENFIWLLSWLLWLLWMLLLKMMVMTGVKQLIIGGVLFTLGFVTLITLLERRFGKPSTGLRFGL